jgi:ribose-phosphate pyrophosphokinase
MKSILFSLDGRTELAAEVVIQANQWSLDNQVILGDVRKQKFSDGELCEDFVNSVRGKRVYLLTSPNTSDEIMKLMLAVDAAKRASAKEVIVILPYFPYARQDKKDQSRGSIGAKVIATMLEGVGVTSVITFDLHADQIQGFFEIPVTHIEGKNVFSKYISGLCNDNTILCGPDAGSGKRVKRMKDKLLKHYGLNLNYIMMEKTRSGANMIESMVIIGDVKGKDVIILDDMVDTAGTLCKAAEVLIEAGATSVRAVITHGVLSGNAFENIGQSKLTELIISDSLPKHDVMTLCTKDFSEERCIHIRNGSAKINVISVAYQIGLSMAATNNDASYEELMASRKELV